MADQDVRCSDAERDEIASLLGRHFGEGRLTLAEYEARLDEVYHGVTRSDLQRSLRELPPLTTPVPVPAPAPRSPHPRRIPTVNLRPLAIPLIIAGIILATGAWWILFPALWFTGGFGLWGGGCGGRRRRHGRRLDRGRDDDLIHV